jgi:thiamine biosynthesis protein ThiS
MNLQLNGETKRFEEVATVAQLLNALDLDRRQVVVELNEKIVRRDEVDRAPVRENDTIEILRFVGGG